MEATIASPVLLVGLGSLVGKTESAIIDGTTYQRILSLVVNSNRQGRVRQVKGGGRQLRRKRTHPGEAPPRPIAVPLKHEVFITDIRVHASLGRSLDGRFSRGIVGHRRTLSWIGLEDPFDMGVDWQLVKNKQPLQPYVEMIPTARRFLAATLPQVPVGLSLTPVEDWAGAALSFGRFLEYKLPKLPGPIHVDEGETMQIELRLHNINRSVDYSVHATGWVQPK